MDQSGRWVGAGLVLAGFYLVSFEFMPPTSVAWQLTNLAGSIGLVISAVSKRDWPPATLNIIFGFIAVVAIIKIVA